MPNPPPTPDLTGTSTRDKPETGEAHEAVSKSRAWKWRKKPLIRIGAAVFILVGVGFIPGLVAKGVFDDKDVAAIAERKHGKNWLEEQERRSAHKLTVTGFRDNNTTVRPVGGCSLIATQPQNCPTPEPQQTCPPVPEASTLLIPIPSSKIVVKKGY